MGENETRERVICGDCTAAPVRTDDHPYEYCEVCGVETRWRERDDPGHQMAARAWELGARLAEAEAEVTRLRMFPSLVASTVPTADDLVAWLQARPDLAVEVVGRLRVAGPWERMGGLSLALVRRKLGTGAALVTAWPMLPGNPVGWDDSRAFHPTATLEEAQAAADAALVAAGWALAGSAPARCGDVPCGAQADGSCDFVPCGRSSR